MHGLENIAVLGAHAQAALLAFAIKLTAQTAHINTVGNHDLKHKKCMVVAALAQNSLEAFNIDAVACKNAAHGSNKAGLVRAIGGDHKGLALQVCAPLTLDGGTHQNRKVNL